MAYENSGSLWKNDRKESDSHPDYTGSWTDANGIEHWLSAWINEKNGKKYMKLTAKRKEAREGPRQPSRAAGTTPLDDDDIPF
jgi:hypothetical protein